jgi:hypothetical protein
VVRRNEVERQKPLFDQKQEQVLTHSKPSHHPKLPYKTESEEEHMGSSLFSPMALALVLFLGLRMMDGVGSAGRERAGMGGECVYSLLVRGVSEGLREQGRWRGEKGGRGKGARQNEYAISVQNQDNPILCHEHHCAPNQKDNKPNEQRMK